MKPKATWHTSLPLLLLLIAGTLSYVSQIRHDAWRWYGAPKVQATYNEYIEPQPLGPEAARAVSLGNQEFLADWYWLKLIQYYGGGEPQGKYRKLAELFNTVTELSPKFLPAYQVGLLVLPGEGFVDEALKLGEKGEQNLPNAWELPYYKGQVYHIYKKDFAQAALEFQKAANKPGAPANTAFFAALYYKEADQRQIAYQLFKTIHDSSQDEFIRDRSEKYLGHLEGIFQLEEAIGAYRQRFGRLPGNLSDLKTQHLLSELPVSPLGFLYVYDPQTGKVQEGK